MTFYSTNRILVSLAVLLVVVSSVWVYLSMPNWPAHTLSDEHRLLGAKSAEQYIAQGIDASSRMQPEYTFDSDYLNYGKTKLWRDGPRVKLDAEGFPRRLQELSATRLLN